MDEKRKSKGYMDGNQTQNKGAWLDALRRIGWQPINNGDVLPAWVSNVVLCRSAECYERKAETKVDVCYFRRPPYGWSEMSGWELWFPLP